MCTVALETTSSVVGMEMTELMAVQAEISSLERKVMTMSPEVWVTTS